MAIVRISNKAKGGTLVNAADYGASPAASAATNTTAINAALAVGDTWLPDGAYTVNGITVPTTRRLTGSWSHKYTATPLNGAQLHAASAGQTSPVVTLAVDSAIDCIAVVGSGEGTSPQHDGILLSGGRATIRSCTITGNKAGVACAYTGVNLITHCQIHDNAASGILDPVDSFIALNYINTNTGNGVTLSSGANDNVITENKIEWNDQYGISAFSTSHNVISNNVIDRNGKAGLRAVSNTRLSVVNNQLRRSGRTASGTANDDCHVYSQDNNQAVFSSNVTHHGVNDDATGYDSPLTSVREQAGTSVTWFGNLLAGCTGATPFTTVTAGTGMLYAANQGLTGIQTLTRHRVRGDTATSATIAASGSSVFSLSLNGALSTFTLGDTYQIILNARRTDNGSRVAAELPVVVSRESGNAAVTVGAITNLVGTAFALTGGATMNVSVTVSTDGATLSVTVSNVSANTYLVGAGITAI